MIRYYRDVYRKPVATLYTIRENEHIYFGISKCNIKHDSFTKEMGVRVAKNRSLLAVEMFENVEVTDGQALIEQRKMYGRWPADAIVDLLKYFEGQEYLPEYARI